MEVLTMRDRLIILIIAIAAWLFLGGCERTPAEPTPTLSGLVIITPTSTPSSTAISVSESPAPTFSPQTDPTEPPAYPAVQTPVAPAATSDPTAYPGPDILTPTLISPGYPGPASSNTPAPAGAYPGIATSTPTFMMLTSTPGSLTPPPPGGYPGPGITATSPNTAVVSTPVATVTSTVPAIPEEIPPVPAVTPPPAGSLVSIWHAWNTAQTAVLDTMIDAFQDIYPGIRFVVTKIPPADLRRSYEMAVYNGEGPDLLIAPAEWGPAYYDIGLVSNLFPYASQEFLSGINPAALGTGMYKEGLICLPVAQKGVVLYRNTQLIPQPANTFDQLVANARATTRAGKLGAYLDRGALFSSGSLYGLGGGVMDAEQAPRFNDLVGLAWLDLMEAYDVAGAVGMNTNRDLELFSAGRVGYIIEGTWQINTLAQAIGEEHLAIDPWPAFGTGHLSGFVQAESIFLNPNTRPGDLEAALLFMGYLLTPDVQQYLAEVEMIPVVIDANPRPVHIAQAATALADGTAYPPVEDPRILTAYWEALELAIQAVFSQGEDPQEALDIAETLVLKRLSEITP